MALNPKQKLALQLLTCGEGLGYQQIADAVGVNQATLWRWRNDEKYIEFQEEFKKLNDERWLATVDVARKAAVDLCRQGNARFIEFVLKNEGYNPTQKVEADVSTNINITIEE